MQKKSVYSIVLSDRIVEQIDRLAYQNGMSRSAMINHILASKLSLVTPEQQMRSILSAAQQLLQDGDALQLLPTRMSPGGIIICETERNEVLPTPGEGFTRRKEYRYGKAKVTTFRREEEV